VYVFPPTLTSSDTKVIVTPAVSVTAINWAPSSTRIELEKATDKRLVALTLNNLLTVKVDGRLNLKALVQVSVLILLTAM
jgi:hypothetical protein